MTVRRATESDFPKIVELLRRFWSESHLPEFAEFDEESLLKTLDVLLVDGVLLTNGVGVIGGLIVPFFFNESKKQAIEMFWYAERDGIALKKEFENWARHEGADVIALGSVPNEKRDSLERVYMRSGYRETERLYLRKIR